MAECRRANRHRRIRARSTPGCSRRGGHRQDRARSPRQLRPARPAFSLGSPWPGRRSLHLPARDRVLKTSQWHFHDRTRRLVTAEHSRAQRSTWPAQNLGPCSTFAHEAIRATTPSSCFLNLVSLVRFPPGAPPLSQSQRFPCNQPSSDVRSPTRSLASVPASVPARSNLGNASVLSRFSTRTPMTKGEPAVTVQHLSG